MRCNDTKIIDKNNSNSNNTNLLSANQEIVATLGVFNRPCVAHQICKGVGKAYNQINGGSANDDAFVD